MSRLAVLILGLVLASCSAAPDPTTDAISRCEVGAALTDLEAARETVSTHMAYPLGGRATIQAAFDSARGQAAGAITRAEHLRALEAFVFALGDHHAHLNANSAASSRLVPTGSTVWAEHRNGRWVITQVRPGSDARRSGLRELTNIDQVNGTPVQNLPLPPYALDGHDAARGFALRVALAGTHGGNTVIRVHEGSVAQDVRLTPSVGRSDHLASLSYPEPGVALVRINNSLGDKNLPAAFDTIMASAREAKIMILDLRDTPSGGDSIVAKPVMSWFVHGVRGYQRHRRGEREWAEQVTGRVDAYRGRLFVLVDHWTGSMGEGVAIGLRSAAGATLIGTPMAGLRGATESFPLPCLAVSLRVPVERLFTMEGEPRERALPDVLISEEALAAAGDNDAVLDAALRQAKISR